MYNYVPNELIVDRAVELWKRALVRPKFDNGDNSESGFTARSFASILDSQTNNSTPEVLERFGTALKAILMRQVASHEFTGDPTPEPDRIYRNYLTTLGTDYGPDLYLSHVAKQAGLTTQFPIKTMMFLRTNSLAFRIGYGADYVYHYPINAGDKRWLVTTLDGAEISKVIDYVQGGKPEFTLEA